MSTSKSRVVSPAIHTRTPKVCRIMAFWAIFNGFGPLFYLLWGFRYLLSPMHPNPYTLYSPLNRLKEFLRLCHAIRLGIFDADEGGAAIAILQLHLVLRHGV